MDSYYAKLARAMLNDAAKQMISVQDAVLQSGVQENIARSAKRILASIRNLQDDILSVEEAIAASLGNDQDGTMEK